MCTRTLTRRHTVRGKFQSYLQLSCMWRDGYLGSIFDVKVMRALWEHTRTQRQRSGVRSTQEDIWALQSPLVWLIYLMLAPRIHTHRHDSKEGWCCEGVHCRTMWIFFFYQKKYTYGVHMVVSAANSSGSPPHRWHQIPLFCLIYIFKLYWNIKSISWIKWRWGDSRQMTVPLLWNLFLPPGPWLHERLNSNKAYIFVFFFICHQLCKVVVLPFPSHQVTSRKVFHEALSRTTHPKDLPVTNTALPWVLGSTPTKSEVERVIQRDIQRSLHLFLTE